MTLQLKSALFLGLAALPAMATAPAISSFTAGTPGKAPGFATTLTAVFSGGTGVIQPGGIAVTSGVPVTVHAYTTTRYELVVSSGTATPAMASITVHPAAIISSTLGTHHTLAVSNTGAIYGWGEDGYGDLDGRAGTSWNSPAPVTTTPGGVKSVSTNYHHGHCLTSGGSVYGWGYTPTGEAGVDPLNGPVVVLPTQTATPAGIVDISTGMYAYGMALGQDGNVWVWGSNNSGNFARPAQYFGTRNNWTATPQLINQFNGHKVAIAAGSASLALADDGTVWSWGANGSGQAGTGVANSTLITTPAQMLSQDPQFTNGIMNGVAAVTAGTYTSFVLRTDGTVWACGTNNVGQLGAPTSSTYSTYLIQVRLPAPTAARHAVAVTAGNGFNFALMSDGTVWGWGYNANGQLGDGTTASATTPKQITGLANIVAIQAGDYFSIAVASDGSLLAWGSDTYHQLGLGASSPVDANGNLLNVLTPTTIPGFKLW